MYRTPHRRLNVPYTGADPGFYEPSKVEMKVAAHYYGVKVGWGQLVVGAVERSRTMMGHGALLRGQGQLGRLLVVGRLRAGMVQMGSVGGRAFVRVAGAAGASQRPHTRMHSLGEGACVWDGRAAPAC